MKSNIQKVIHQIEKEQNIRVLMAGATGSRASSCPSIDSDHDICLIYTHPKDWYISLYEKKDDLNLYIEKNRLDVYGWDLRKTLNLLYRSNVSLFELIQSPIVYAANEAFISEMQDLAAELYSPLTATYHYLSLAKKALAEIGQNGSTTLTLLFEAIRPTLACKWLAEKQNRPPVSIYKLMEGINLNIRIEKRVRDLTQLKSCQNQSYEHSREQEIIDFLDATILEVEKNAHHMAVAKNKGVDLNEVFVRWINDNN